MQFSCSECGLLNDSAVMPCAADPSVRVECDARIAAMRAAKGKADAEKRRADAARLAAINSATLAALGRMPLAYIFGALFVGGLYYLVTAFRLMQDRPRLEDWEFYSNILAALMFSQDERAMAVILTLGLAAVCAAPLRILYGKIRSEAARRHDENEELG